VRLQTADVEMGKVELVLVLPPQCMGGCDEVVNVPSTWLHLAQELEGCLHDVKSERRDLPSWHVRLGVSFG
jgi:hypothetical protein